MIREEGKEDRHPPHGGKGGEPLICSVGLLPNDGRGEGRGRKGELSLYPRFYYPNLNDDDDDDSSLQGMDHTGNKGPPFPYATR